MSTVKPRERKADQYDVNELQRQRELYRDEAGRFGARRLDGVLPHPKLCQAIAAEARAALRSSPALSPAQSAPTSGMATSDPT